MAHDREKYQFSVDGALHSTNDNSLDGEQVRQIAGLAPASEFVLVEVMDGVARSVGLEDKVELKEGVVTVFVSFRSDRIYTFTIDERGWEWGAATITAADIYRFANISEDLELILDSAGDEVIPFDGDVKLSNDGVERIRSRESKTVTIKVNGRRRVVEKRRHSYREIAAIAYPNPDFDKFNYTITYLRGVHGAEGDLVEGETIEVKNGMVFNVRRSDKS